MAGRELIRTGERVEARLLGMKIPGRAVSCWEKRIGRLWIKSPNVCPVVSGCQPGRQGGIATLVERVGGTV